VHIPDGYLSPLTCAAAFAVSVPFWGIAAAKVKDVVKTRHVPTLAIFSAVCFLAMMFNIPIPDGTSAHAVGAAVIAIILGPWAAVIAVSVALLFQALLFGDGGVLAFGANALNLAIIMPFVAIGVYRLVGGRSELTSSRRVIAAALAGYVSINAAALATAVELGIQPALFTAADGSPLYSPYTVPQAIAGMALAHLTLAGAAEAILSAAVVVYLQRANLPLLRINHQGLAAPGEITQPARLRPGLAAAIAVGFMTLLTPLGLIAPGGAFGEDAPEELDLAGLNLSAIPQGLHEYSTFWQNSIWPDYAFGGGESPWVSYMVSAVAGIAVVGLVVYLIALAIRAVATRRHSQLAASRTSDQVS
jgi:cobalt/nickel transport system permease protein